MRVSLDIEANGLENPTEIWLVCCIDLDTDEVHVFRNLTSDAFEKERFHVFFQSLTHVVGHNLLGYDWPHMDRLLGIPIEVGKCTDTLIVSKLVNYSRPEKHSLEAYGKQFGFPKISFSDFSKYSEEMEVYCVRDAQICKLIYEHYSHIISDPEWSQSLATEHRFQLCVNALHQHGFHFNSVDCQRLLQEVTQELETLDAEIIRAFPPKLKLIREITPKVTKFGTLSRTDFRWVDGNDLSTFNGGSFCRCEWKDFNPSSHRQIIGVLNDAGWHPSDRTKAHIETERELQRLRFFQGDAKQLDIRKKELYTKLQAQRITGWKINENNLDTLPENAPAPARTLARRILLESRRRTLTEWLGLTCEDGRIHGKFYGIGAWTHRMSHQHPNTANIPTHKKLYGAKMRALWCAPKGRLLVGVDAEAIQLRIFAHYINDGEFTNALVTGRKEDKTDPHSLNKSILGSVCIDRDIAKRFIFALVLGAGIGKLAEILGCDVPEAQEALDRLIIRYPGLKFLRETIIPSDAERGWFYGLDSRKVLIPNATVGGRRHLAMSGYLQNGEAVVMKMACLLWHDFLEAEGVEFKLVNFVHDEWQTEIDNNISLALKVAKVQADALFQVGEILKLNCPLSGSFRNDDGFTFGKNWQQTH